MFASETVHRVINIIGPLLGSVIIAKRFSRFFSSFGNMRRAAALRGLRRLRIRSGVTLACAIAVPELAWRILRRGEHPLSDFMGVLGLALLMFIGGWLAVREWSVISGLHDNVRKLPE